MQELLTIGANALKKAALNEEAKEYLLGNETLFRILKRAADRYIGGETLEEAAAKVEQHNQQGFKCSPEFIGESTRTEKETISAARKFIRICQLIGLKGLHLSINIRFSWKTCISMREFPGNSQKKDLIEQSPRQAGNYDSFSPGNCSLAEQTIFEHPNPV